MRFRTAGMLDREFDGSEVDRPVSARGVDRPVCGSRRARKTCAVEEGDSASTRMKARRHGTCKRDRLMKLVDGAAPGRGTDRLFGSVRTLARCRPRWLIRYFRDFFRAETPVGNAA